MPPLYHRNMMEKLVEIEEEKTELELKGMKTKQIYKLLCKDLPQPRLLEKNLGFDTAKVVWPRLGNPVLGIMARGVLFQAVNGIYRNKEHMARVWGVGDPMCDVNPDPTGQCAGELQTLSHMFQSCYKVSEAWGWLRAYLYPTTYSARKRD